MTRTDGVLEVFMKEAIQQIRRSEQTKLILKKAGLHVRKML